MKDTVKEVVHPITSGHQLQRQARRYAHRAIEKLAKMVEDDDPKVAFPAAKELLNRGFGTAPQTVELIDSRPGVQNMSDEALDMMHKQLQRFAQLKQKDPALFDAAMAAMQPEEPPEAEVVRVPKSKKGKDAAPVEGTGTVIDMAANRKMRVVCRACANRWVGVKGSFRTIAQARKQGHIIKCPRCWSESAVKDTKNST